MRNPKIGEQVLYTAPHAEGAPRQVWPATVAFVHADGVHVNIGGFDADGKPFARTAVQMIDPSEDGLAMGDWATWSLSSVNSVTEAPVPLTTGPKSVDKTEDKSVVATGVNDKTGSDEAQKTADKTGPTGKK